MKIPKNVRVSILNEWWEPYPADTEIHPHSLIAKSISLMENEYLKALRITTSDDTQISIKVA